jgi:hypothetical protein
VLDLSTTPVPTAAYPGDKVTLYLVVHANNAVAHSAKLVLSATPTAVTTPSGSTGLGDLTTTNKMVTVTVTIPATMTPGKLSLTAKVSAAADKVVPKSTVRTITVAAKPVETATTSTTTSLPTTAPTSGTEVYTAPSPAGSIQPTSAAAVALPQIAAAAPSSAAPSSLSGSTTALREGSPDSQELTFQRVASTQAAWLAALLVAFSVLLTQVRLAGIRPARSRNKGDHRRNRRGLFGR